MNSANNPVRFIDPWGKVIEIEDGWTSEEEKRVIEKINELFEEFESGQRSSQDTDETEFVDDPTKTPDSEEEVDDDNDD